MRSRAWSVTLLSLSLLLAESSCRSRRPAPEQPQTAPPVTATTPAQEPTIPVQPPTTDFPAQEPERDVLSSDIEEANRQARAQGWIRDAFFAFDASTLDADAQAALRQSAEWLRSNSSYGIRIEGHCDERGTEQYNLALGERRAETAAAFLAASGVDRSRIQTVSYGEERPFETGSDEAAWSQNRRAHLVLTRR